MPLSRIHAWTLRALEHAWDQSGRAQRAIGELALLYGVALQLPRAAIDARYDRSDKYFRREHQERGLFPFEERALAAYFPPPPARLLVHGAGSGREVRALVRRGYSVEAYEPAPALLRAANEALAPDGVTILAQTVQAWARAPHGEFDGVLTGWGMWTHLLGRRERQEVLSAFRRVCPRGPVLLSFWRGEKLFDPEERNAETPLFGNRVQRLLRGTLATRVLRLAPLERGTAWRGGLFVHLVSEAELAEEAREAGYAITYFERDCRVFPNAILTPA